MKGEADGTQYESIADAFRKIHAQEGGVAAFFAGLKADLAKSALDSFLFFLFYNYLRAWLRSRRRLAGVKKRSLSPLQELAAGAVAGACSRLLTTPVGNVVARRQTAGPGAQARDVSFWESMAEIRREKGGFLGLWSGYSATLVLTLNPSITFFLQDALAAAAADGDLEDDAGPGFLIAAVSKVVATAVTYPFQMTKARVQVASGPTEKEEGPGEDREQAKEPVSGGRRNSLARGVRGVVTNNIFATVLKIARTEGAGALYDGIGGEMLKAFFNHGITMLSKDIVHKFILQLYFAIVGLLKRHPELRSRLSQTRRNLSRQIRQRSLQVSLLTTEAGRRAAQHIGALKS